MPREPTLIPARILTQENDRTIAIVMHPGRLDAVDADGNPTEATGSIDIEDVPGDLRAPNTEIWLVIQSFGDISSSALEFKQSVFPRHGMKYPKQFEHLETK